MKCPEATTKWKVGEGDGLAEAGSDSMAGAEGGAAARPKTRDEAVKVQQGAGWLRHKGSLSARLSCPT